MKRKVVDIKRIVKKRIELRHQNLVFIEKNNKMNERDIKRYAPKPVNVELISRDEIRTGKNSRRTGRGTASSENIFYDIKTSEYPISLYKKLLNKKIVGIEKHKILFLISNYERKEMLNQLLDEIKTFNTEKIIVDYMIFDDVSSYTIDDPNVIVNDEHRGKFNYWKTFNDMFKYCEKNPYDIYVFSPNDFSKYDINKIVRYGIKLIKHKYIFNTFNDKRATCWNTTQPINLTDEVDLIFFSDCGFFTNHITLKALEFKMNEIITRNSNISSQVGKQLTNRLNILKIPIFHPIDSIVSHGNHPSLMNSEKIINNLSTNSTYIS